MTREEFVAGYMARSEIADWKLDGDLVTFAGCQNYALPCRCGEKGCAGWAMVPLTGRGWHLYRNTDDVTYAQAAAIDREARAVG